MHKENHFSFDILNASNVFSDVWITLEYNEYLAEFILTPRKLAFTLVITCQSICHSEDNRLSQNRKKIDEASAKRHKDELLACSLRRAHTAA